MNGCGSESNDGKTAGGSFPFAVYEKIGREVMDG